ncbi:uncharacterized protein LOC120442857 isoform X1 [Oreochromis aureus]|uniref:uncharacterized protein LOC120442857 isoform X1 n=2 Tax=Oreochromis aureus TaxID=47969 RepID=UPI0019544447|nr:uncharacterized protein LOC120442857 isoform X1 [Oreochromis aureus]
MQDTVQDYSDYFQSSACLTGMRPSISASLEPGLERGVPWGRDLYTFVTSAAGHMMRTLQKPKKNRPSKRQVNHRRFLHNMIQRKFADIEAANQRLAYALYFKDEDKGVSSLSSHKPDSPDQSGNPSQSGGPQDADKSRLQTGIDGTSKSISVSSSQVNTKRKQTESGHLWKHHSKSQSSTCRATANKQSNRMQEKGNRGHKLVEIKPISSPRSSDLYGAELFYFNNESESKPADNHQEDTESTTNDFIQLGQNVDISPSFSPELSPLSLDSCDFSIQVLTDLAGCAQAQKSYSNFSEGQLTDIMEPFSIDNKDLGDCTDIEAYFESICACHGDDDDIFGDRSHNFTEVDDLHCEGECRYEYAYADQGLTSDHFQGNHSSSVTLRQGAYTEEEQFNTFKLCQSTDINQKQIPSSVSYHYNATQLQAYQCSQEESTCMQVNCENNLQFTPFEGVAQSFTVPLNNAELRPIPTPPQEDNWLFTDILKDRKSPSY